MAELRAPVVRAIGYVFTVQPRAAVVVDAGLAGAFACWVSQSAVRTPVRRSRRIDRAEYDTQQSYRDERASSSACTAQLTGGARHMHQGEHDPADRQHTTPHPRKLAGTRGALKLRTSADVAHLLRGPGTPRVYCIDTVRVLSGW